MNKLSFAGVALLCAVASAAALDRPALTAQAQLNALALGGAAGVVEFRQSADTLQVIANLTGLSPGLHAFHLHRQSSCEAVMSPGGHIDPSIAAEQGERSEHHGGVFGALAADQDGVARLNLLLLPSTLSLDDADRSVVGRTLVVHGSPDDFVDWPASAGGRAVACGVIRATGSGGQAPTHVSGNSNAARSVIGTLGLDNADPQSAPSGAITRWPRGRSYQGNAIAVPSSATTGTGEIARIP
jgi:Cu-Zn family superoxide dismutase